MEKLEVEMTTNTCVKIYPKVYLASEVDAYREKVKRLMEAIRLLVKDTNIIENGFKVGAIHIVFSEDVKKEVSKIKEAIAELEKEG